MPPKKHPSRLTAWAEAFTVRHAPFLQPLWFGFLSLRWILMGGLMLVLVMQVVRYTRVAPPEPVPSVEAVPSLQPTTEVGWTTDGGTPLLMLNAVLSRKLPEPGQGQVNTATACKPPGRFVDGGCWIPVADEVPPCTPTNGEHRTMWPHDGKCWLPVPRTARGPTSGEPRPGSVADP